MQIYLICLIIVYYLFKYFLGENEEIYNDYSNLNDKYENEELNHFLKYFGKSLSLNKSISNSFSIKKIIMIY